MDFIVGLLAYRGHTTILVVVGCFSKGIHLGMLQPHYTAHTITLLFMEIVGKHHGMPRSLVLDHDPLFISHFWKELFKLSGTKLRMSFNLVARQKCSSPYRQYLQAFLHNQPSSWGIPLIWDEWSYNTSRHSSMGVSPYEVTFDKKPPSIPQYIVGTSKIEAVDDFWPTRKLCLPV